MVFAEQLADQPPLEPIQLHPHGSLPLTLVDVPALQRLVLGSDVNVPPFDEPQTPFTGFI